MRDVVIVLAILAGIWAFFWALLFWLTGVATHWQRRTRHVASSLVGLLLVFGVVVSLSWNSASLEDDYPVAAGPPPTNAPAPSEPQAPSEPAQPEPSGSTATPPPRPPADRPGQAFLPPFPWPPPRPSALIVIPNSILTPHLSHRRLGNVEVLLDRTLGSNGYWEASNYEVPRGFAMVVRLERINEDGSPFPEDSRWNQSGEPIKEFSLGAYLRALFQAPAGFYRVVVFVVTSEPFAATGPPITASDANDLLMSGANILPPRIAEMPYTDDYACTVLIYEFETSQETAARKTSRLSANAHLVKSGIARALEWPLK